MSLCGRLEWFKWCSRIVVRIFVDIKRLVVMIMLMRLRSHHITFMALAISGDLWDRPDIIHFKYFPHLIWWLLWLEKLMRLLPLLICAEHPHKWKHLRDLALRCLCRTQFFLKGNSSSFPGILFEYCCCCSLWIDGSVFPLEKEILTSLPFTAHFIVILFYSKISREVLRGLNISFNARRSQ